MRAIGITITVLLVVIIIIISNVNKIQNESLSADLTFQPYRGRVNTYIEGVDVGQVNLWSSDGENRYLFGTCNDNDTVVVLGETETHYKVRNIKQEEGYCRKEFINKIY